MNNSVNILRHGDNVKSVGFGRICTNNCTLILDSATIEIQYNSRRNLYKNYLMHLEDCLFFFNHETKKLKDSNLDLGCKSGSPQEFAYGESDGPPKIHIAPSSP